jgi:hypothetical protein
VVERVVWSEAPAEVWNLEVHRAHTYLVGGAGVLVHNAKHGKNAQCGDDDYDEDDFKPMAQGDNTSVNPKMSEAMRRAGLDPMDKKQQRAAHDALKRAHPHPTTVEGLTDMLNEEFG